MKNFYELLGVLPSADMLQLKAAYRRRVLEVHPDKKGGCVELCQQVMAAFELLVDPTQRKSYDSSLAHAAPNTKGAWRRCPSRRSDFYIRKRSEAPPSNLYARVSAGTKKCSASAARPKHNAWKGRTHDQHRASGGFATKRRATQRGVVLLARVVTLLRRLSHDCRKEFILQRLTPAQRKDMEMFMKSVPAPKCSKQAATAEFPWRPIVQSGKCSGYCAATAKPESSNKRKISTIGCAASALVRRVSSRSKVGREAAAGEHPAKSILKQGTTLPRVAATQHRCSRELRAARKIASGARGGTSIFAPLSESSGCRGTAPKTRGAAQMRGIVQTNQHGNLGYHAKVTFAYVAFRGKFRRSLEEAVDDHAVLLAAKVHALGMIEDESQARPEDVMEEALLQVHQADLGCRISISMPNRYAHYLVGRGLTSPSYGSSSSRDLSAALRAWQQFRLASDGDSPPTSGGRGTAFRAPPGASEVQEKWLRIRAAYLDAWANRGANVERLAGKIDGLMASRAPHRERDWENHEEARMAREERRQRAEEAASAHRQDRSRLHNRRAGISTEAQELHCLRRLAALTGRWTPNPEPRQQQHP